MIVLCSCVCVCVLRLKEEAEKIAEHAMLSPTARYLSCVLFILKYVMSISVYFGTQVVFRLMDVIQNEVTTVQFLSTLHM